MTMQGTRFERNPVGELHFEDDRGIPHWKKGFTTQNQSLDHSEQIEESSIMLQLPTREKTNGATAATKAVILVSFLLRALCKDLANFLRGGRSIKRYKI